MRLKFLKKAAALVTAAAMSLSMIMILPEETLPSIGFAANAEENTSYNGRLSLGAYHSAYITENGDLYTWGYNEYGQLGDGTTENRSTPVKIMSDVAQVSLGNTHSACVTKSGDLYTWGCNGGGCLGNGDREDSCDPIRIMSGVSQVNLGVANSSCLTENGDLYTWGNNCYGQLGDGTTENRSTPVKIMSNVAQVNLYNYQGACVTKSGDLYTWGLNRRFYPYDKNATPQLIMSDVTQVSLGDYHSAYITENGDLYTWGYNEFGQLGDGTTEDRFTPVKIMSNVAQVSLGTYHSAYITENGDMYIWGYNGYGLLGNGTTENNPVPTKLMGNVSQVCLGYLHDACMTADGKMYIWGNNIYGQLGDGTTTDSYVPIKVSFFSSEDDIGEFDFDIEKPVTYFGESVTLEPVETDTIGRTFEFKNLRTLTEAEVEAGFKYVYIVQTEFNESVEEMKNNVDRFNNDLAEGGRIRKYCTIVNYDYEELPPNKQIVLNELSRVTLYKINTNYIDTQLSDDYITYYYCFAMKDFAASPAASGDSEYTITFDANGGFLHADNTALTTDGKLFSLPEPVRENYEFLGWFTQPADGDPSDCYEVTESTTFSSDTTIYAHWKQLPQPHEHSCSNVYSSDETGHWYACSGCEEKVDFAEHTSDEGTVTKEPTEKEEGIKTFKCTVCGYVIKTEPIEKLEHTHTPASEYSSDETGHWYTCSGCEEKVDFAEHTSDEGTVTKEPTDKEEGIKTFKCTVCSYVIKTEPIEKLEHIHTPASEYSSDETGHWYTCSGCDEKIDYEAHTKDEGTVTKEATLTESGTVSYKCKLCGADMGEATVTLTINSIEVTANGVIFKCSSNIDDQLTEITVAFDDVTEALVDTMKETDIQLVIDFVNSFTAADTDGILTDAQIKAIDYVLAHDLR